MDHDILVSGGGIAGLTATAAFAQAGFNVICVDPAKPITVRDAQGADLRSTAFLQPARALLEEVGLWTRLAPHAQPLQIMRIIDAGGPEPEARMSKEFDAADISDHPFGWNLPNWLLRREMAAHLETLPNVTYKTGVGARTLFTRTAEARVGLSDSTRVSARLVIAADGRGSPMREAAGINVSTTRFGQKALAFAVTHETPHENVSTEIHRTGGPFTLVPLPDHEGRPSSAIVWMEEGPKAKALYEMSEDSFEVAMNTRSCGVLGLLKLASQRTIWPIISQHADRLSSERLALIAEAAHVLPPIGAQGLNMSLSDIRALRDLAIARPEGLGDAAMLDAFHKARFNDIRLREAGITLLNQTSMLSAAPLRDARAAGLNALYSFAPLRKSIMQMGLGANG
ncbi:2-octaprenyl-6-methoxyphenol hydroxylase [Planktotalea frisia]|jgi:2-octaprenyl-6-methoxyphenol hydroxylase|uniref:2-octaprenyl-3-methyl-6-methoxy-1,4-benzoquinol hydroxylase n=1 Tax=Planktotalea frisia TaxID=696762 RepID=A0A1L9NYU2_9RHOB|nr:UbiH/UbiF family hydroxylase [Planktotalea frisia]OJI94372.1 2-octaprenyl-3-methyl-6-methoxy-1,4-benzoquinol hydroxylase [Planktotalea frisia]PZX30123.1 2-octaprenyl-6-methoxyphenol hydroxylase [Planktotalea frisia]